MAAVVVLLTVAASTHVKKLEGDAFAEGVGREPLFASITAVGMSLLGTMAGVSLLLLLILVLHALGGS